MTPILKVNNNELSFRLKLNYNNVYSRLKMLLGPSASVFADISTKTVATTWYTEDNREYTPVSEATASEQRDIYAALNRELANIRKELSKSSELAPYADDILEVPDSNFIFYRKDDGGYHFVLAGWGCRQAHTPIAEGDGFIRSSFKKVGVEEEKPVAPEKTPFIKDDEKPVGNQAKPSDSETNSSDNTKDVADEQPATVSENKPEIHETSESSVPPEAPPVVTETPEPPVPPVVPKKKKEQRVIVRIINQHNLPVEDEEVKIRTNSDVVEGYTDEDGRIEAGSLPYHSTFGVSFPNMANVPERTFEVVPKQEVYEVFIKKYIKYSPVLFVEDQNGNAVDNYNVKVMIAGQEYMMDSGFDGMIQLPTIQEGQKFVVIDPSNYANSAEYAVTAETVKAPFRFTIRRAEKTKVGITVLDKNHKPMEGVTVDVTIDVAPCQEITGADGRAEFPAEVFNPGEVDVKLYVKGRGTINSKLNYSPENSEYSIQLTPGKKRGNHFNWKWLLLLPLLFLLGMGGKYLYDHMKKGPTISEMEKGVCMLFGSALYYVDLSNLELKTVPDNEPITDAYFCFDPQTGEPMGFTFNRENAKQYALGWTGTGFLISDDGLIATNRHVVDPIEPGELQKMMKHIFQRDKTISQRKVDELSERLRQMSGSGYLFSEEGKHQYELSSDSLRHFQNQVQILDQILNTGDFSVKKEVYMYAAFTGTRLEKGTTDELIACSEALEVGEPAGTQGNDLGIIQIKKAQDIPKDAYVFRIPDEDIMDKPIPDNYDITVLGYNAGPWLQNMDKQRVIKPQAQHGKINNTSEKYRIGYDASIMGGSSGSPVLNSKGELVAVNNSKVRDEQGFSWGIRTKYLKELYEKVRNGNEKKK